MSCYAFSTSLFSLQCIASLHTHTQPVSPGLVCVCPLSRYSLAFSLDAHIQSMDANVGSSSGTGLPASLSPSDPNSYRHHHQHYHPSKDAECLSAEPVGLDWWITHTHPHTHTNPGQRHEHRTLLAIVMHASCLTFTSFLWVWCIAARHLPG